AMGKSVLYVTERAVFRLTGHGLELVEIAPGMEVDRDIRSAVGCDFTVSEALKPMDPVVFSTEPLGLAERLRDQPWKKE
ncbi:MAG: hypothetical protein ACOC9Q_01100, partial [bacterium]